MQHLHSIKYKAKGGIKLTRKQSLKLQVSFKETIRDLEIYNFLLDEIKAEIGISVYIKMLIAEDMKKRKNQK